MNGTTDSSANVNTQTDARNVHLVVVSIAMEERANRRDTRVGIDPVRLSGMITNRDSRSTSQAGLFTQDQGIGRKTVASDILHTVVEATGMVIVMTSGTIVEGIGMIIGMTVDTIDSRKTIGRTVGGSTERQDRKIANVVGFGLDSDAHIVL